jgi:hypothetical protein
MWPAVNVGLQAVLSGVIHGLGPVSGSAATANAVGQGIIHGLAVASGPIGWIAGGALTAAIILLLFLL